MKNYRWSEEETNYLINNIQKKPLKVISEELCRTYASVMGKVKQQGLRKDNYVKEGWSVIKSFTEDQGVYSLLETTNKLSQHKDYMGRGGYRKLQKQDPKLYNSVYEYSKELDLVKDKNSKSFIARVVFITKHNTDINSIKCQCGCNISFKQKYSPYCDYEYNYQPFCVKCQPKYPSEKYFKFKYGSEWELHRDERRSKLSKLKTNSKEWFINKYGDNWESPYLEYYNNKISTLHENNSKLFKDTYSKISQNLFNEIVKHIPPTNKVYYATNNGEFFINLDDETKLKLGKHCIKPDFKVGKKIIEFNGEYWHNKSKDEDELRYSLMMEMGFNVMVINEKEYKNNKEKVLNDCINFVNGK